MGRNLVLFSDGTGNKGGDGADTNVFRLYHAVNRSKPKDGAREQITFYDNGVGTAKHAVWRAITGATGFGFRDNVADLYEFAGRHYRDGDDIYAFGFSRGAATVRAFAGMVEHIGLVCKQRKDDNGNYTKESELPEEDFQEQLEVAMRKYVRRKNEWSLGRIFGSMFGVDWKLNVNDNVEIEVLGVWDTVAALGFPQLGPLDNVVNFFRRHEFYDFEPKSKVRHVFHAVAIDDERRTFWPLFWNENNFEGHIEQVWFAGVHSNVGGGYNRAGLANVTLNWMVARLAGHTAYSEDDPANGPKGLVLEDDFGDEVRQGINTQGKLYDSRAGLALFYRFQPRPITSEWSDHLKGGQAFRIHASVLERMELQTARYAPGHLPNRYTEVESHPGGNPKETSLISPVVRNIDMTPPVKEAPAKERESRTSDPRDEWLAHCKSVDKITDRRIQLYWCFFNDHSSRRRCGALFLDW